MTIEIAKLENNFIEYKLNLPEGLAQHFNRDRFHIKYDMKIDDCNKKSLMVPAQAFIIMLGQILNVDVDVGEIDETFYKSIMSVLDDFKSMYPHISFGCDIKYTPKHDNYVYNNRSILYFSGGIDSFSTLCTHYEENPVVLTINGINNGVDDNKEFIRSIGINQHLSMSTNIRTIINENELATMFNFVGNSRTFFNSYPYTVVLAALSAPLCEKLKISKIYFASSYDYRYTKIQSAQTHSLANKIKFSNTIVWDDGSEYTRMEKVKRCLKFFDKLRMNGFLKVCFDWKENCCRCEKCGRTILELLSEGRDPKDYGFCKPYDIQQLVKNVNTIYLSDIVHNYKQNGIALPDALKNANFSNVKYEKTL